MFDGLAKIVETVANLLDDSRIPWKSVVVASIIGNFASLTYLDIRQYVVQNRPSPPAVLAKRNIVDNEVFRKSQAYTKARLGLRVFRRAVDTTFKLWLFGTTALPKLWQLSVSLAPRFYGGGELTAGILLYAIQSAIQSVVGLPAQLYDTFVIEERFGFNKQSLGLFAKDKLKMWALWLALIVPLQAVFQAIVYLFGYHFVVYAQLIILAVGLLSEFIVPALITPLFNKLTPLEESELRTEVVKLAESEGFPTDSIFVIDGSTQSGHSNASFTGLPYYKRILLDDTLINDQSTPEIVAVLAHELGHWKLNHVPLLILFQSLTSGYDWFELGLLIKNRSFYHSLGFQNTESPVMVPMIFGFLIFPLKYALTFLGSWFSRHYEYAADEFAVKKGYAKELAESLAGYHKSNLNTYDDDWLYSSLYHDHPTLTQRLGALEIAQKKLE